MTIVEGAASPTHRGEFGAQRFGLPEGAVGVDVLRVGTVDGAGDVAGDRIERLDFAAKALRAAGVDDTQRSIVQAREDLGRRQRSSDAADRERRRA